MEGKVVISIEEAERAGDIIIPFTANLMLHEIENKEKRTKAYIAMLELVSVAKITGEKFDISRMFVALDDQDITFDGFRAVLMVLDANNTLKWGDDKEEDRACKLLINPRKSPNEEGIKAMKKAIAIVRAELLKGDA